MGAATWAGGRGSRHCESSNPLCRLGGREVKKEEGRAKGPKLPAQAPGGVGRALRSQALFFLALGD